MEGVHKNLKLVISRVSAGVFEANQSDVCDRGVVWYVERRDVLSLAVFDRCRDALSVGSY